MPRAMGDSSYLCILVGNVTAGRERTFLLCLCSQSRSGERGNGLNPEGALCLWATLSYLHRAKCKEPR